MSHLPIVAWLRLGTWWRHLVPPLLAVVYATALLAAPAAGPVLAALPLFLVSVLGIAGLGYFLNDVSDVAVDRRAGKANAAAGLSPRRRLAVLAALLVVGLAPWLLLPRRPLALGLLGVEVALLAAYSLPPLRLKERGAGGLLADAGYGHALPLLVAAALFSPPPAAAWPPRPSGLVVLAAAWALAKGLRNITLHQLADRKNDRRASCRTFVGGARPVAVLDVVNRGLLPLELALLVALLAALAAPLVVAGFALFLAFTALKFSAWKMPFMPRRQLRFKFHWFLNDFYEEWAPLLLLAAWALRQPAAWLLLPVHLLLFPHLGGELGRDLALIGRNLREAAAGIRAAPAPGAG
jgi:4-hydroxybenzoate polyprenyltransferase